MSLMIVQPLLELYIRSSPFRIRSPAWRLSLIGNASGAICGAGFSDCSSCLRRCRRRGQRESPFWCRALSALTAVCCLAATGLFALDALQMEEPGAGKSVGDVRTRVSMDRREVGPFRHCARCDFFSALRGAHRATRSMLQQAGKSSSVIANGGGRPTVGVRPTADAESR